MWVNMDRDLDGKVDFEEYWKWARPHFIRKGWKPDRIDKFKVIFKKSFNRVAGKKGYMTFKDFSEELKRKYGIKD